MNAAIDPNSYNYFFAVAPFAILAVVLVAVYFIKRREWASNPPIGQSLSCANCGRSSRREQMVPQTHDGNVGWYCSRCAGVR